MISVFWLSVGVFIGVLIVGVPFLFWLSKLQIFR